MGDWLELLTVGIMPCIGFVFSMLQSGQRNRAELKLKKMEIVEARRMDTISDFLRLADEAVRSENARSLYHFQSSFSPAVVYMNRKQAGIAVQLRVCIEAGEKERARELLTELSLSLQA